MAQREEETEIHVSETTLTLCVNNCGFHGNPATKNMCQGCFQAAQNNKPASPKRQNSPPVARSGQIRPAVEADRGVDAGDGDAAGTQGSVAARMVYRCSGCRRKVGLTGFRCRCGKLFCGQHRYSDRHDCSFDYKTAGREAISQENPVVRASKIVKI